MDFQCAEDESHVAECYCSACDAVFCERCYLIVHSSNFTASHEKLPISKRSHPLPKCPNHPNNTAEFYCIQKKCTKPSKLFCHTCRVTSHQGHPFEELTKKIKKEKDALLDMVLSNLKMVEQLEKNKKEMEAMEAIYSRKSEKYKDTEEKIVRWFDEQKKCALAELEKFSDEKLEAIGRNKECLEKELEMVKQWNEKTMEEVGSIWRCDFGKVERVVKEIGTDEQVMWDYDCPKQASEFPKFINFCNKNELAQLEHLFRQMQNMPIIKALSFMHRVRKLL